MSARKICRVQAHAARKAARKAGFPITTPSLSVAPSASNPSNAELAAILNQPLPFYTTPIGVHNSGTSNPRTLGRSALRSQTRRQQSQCHVVAYRNTHTRAFHKCLADLLKLCSERRKAELGVEAQRVESEKQELKKELHSWELVRKDAAVCRELAQLSSEKLAAAQQNPNFYSEYNAELAKRGLESNICCGATKAA